MLRCQNCGGYAVAGLAHLHGDPCRPLCETCTAEVVKEREEREAKERFLRELLQDLDLQAA